MAKKWYDYTPVGFISNLATKWLGLQSNPIGDFMDATSDQLFGTNYRAEKMLSQQYQMNSQLANDERAWQERMLSESRAYNSPANQMRLMREAGLNPALAYGQLSDLGGTTPSAGAASVGIPSASFGSTPDTLLSLAKVRQVDADIHKVNAETKAIIDKLPKELKILDATEENIKSQVTLNGQLVNQSKEYTKVLGQDFEQKFIENEYLSQTLQHRIAIVVAEKKIKATEAEYIRDNLVAQIANLRESSKLMRSNRFLNAQLGAHYAAIDRNLSAANRQMDAMTDYIERKSGNIPIENIMGFINAGSSFLHSASGLVGNILSRGQKPEINVGYPKGYNISQ